jgi:hypothetical protein
MTSSGQELFKYLAQPWKIQLPHGALDDYVPTCAV